MTNTSPYTVIPAPLVGPESEFPKPTVTVYPHGDGGLARIDVCGQVYEIGEAEEIYWQLWSIIDYLTGDVTCDFDVSSDPLYPRTCDAPVYGWGKNECPAHESVASMED